MLSKTIYHQVSKVLDKLLNFPPLKRTVKKALGFIQSYKKAMVTVFLALLISDLLLIKSYFFLIPNKELAPLKSSISIPKPDSSSLLVHKLVWENNLFHTGPLPSFVKALPAQSLEPVPSELPWTLKGTLIHANPKKSIATIWMSKEKKSTSYQPEDIIESQAEVKSIEREKLIFFNLNNNRLEYLEIPKNQKDSLKISYEKPSPTGPKSKHPIINLGDNKYLVKRSDVNRYLKRLSDILQDARMVPHKQGGLVVGFRFASIDKNSVYEELGFKKGDIIKQANGHSVTSPEEALKLFDQLKSESRLNLLVERKGKELELGYSVDENAAIP